MDKPAFPLPSISEDTLHYTLHVPRADEAQATLITAQVQSLLPQPWLWNKDGWELKVGDRGDGGKGDWEGALEGTMRVGDAVDDEWLVVWLLREVSRTSEAVISIRDTDGEFMLIEAAHVLPSWVTPENSENRLWLYKGQLHLLPLSIRSDASNRPRQIADDDYDEYGRAVDLNAWVSVPDAIAAVRTGDYRAPEVEKAVWERISCYPEALGTHLHRTKAYLPVKVAQALSKDPELIQKAVEGFYVRDPAQLRAAARMTHFPPSPAVLVPVRMTRAAYAQLQGQVFHPPRVFGPEWHVREDEGDERRYRDLGVKIATGFEIMYREGGRKGRIADRSVGVEELGRDDAYRRYIADLKGKGFFWDEREGSEKWKEREGVAAKGWIEARAADTTQQRPSFAWRVDSAIEGSGDVEELKAGPNDPEDSDSWLEVDPEELDAMLVRMAGGGTARAGEKVEVTEEDGKALQELADKVQAFVGGQGDMEGARFADELSDEDMDSDSEEEEVSPEQREEVLRKLVPGLTEEEWGSKLPESDAKVTAQVPPTKKGTVAGTAFGDSLLPTKMRPPVFEKVTYDGVESDSDTDEELPLEGSLGRHIAQMKWGDGEEAHVEELSDEEDGDEEDKADRARAKALRFDHDEEMHDSRQKGDLKDGDVDMENEQADFLKFSREALGIDDEQWESILANRRERGAYIPADKPTHKVAKAAQKVEPEDELMDVERKPNAALNSFESMMAAMEAELARTKEAKQEPPAAKVQFTKPKSSTATKPKAKPKPKVKSKLTLTTLPTEEELDAMDDEALAAMDAELRQALVDAGEEVEDIPEAEELDEDQKKEYAMMKHLLESYKSQDGSAGVVGNLFGRLQ